MINSCKRYISCNGTKTIWQQEEDEVKDKITSCIILNEEYQKCFSKVKNELDPETDKELNFCEVFVFGKFDAFCNRLKKILKLFDCMDVHDSMLSYEQEGL